MMRHLETEQSVNLNFYCNCFFYFSSSFFSADDWESFHISNTNLEKDVTPEEPKEVNELIK